MGFGSAIQFGLIGALVIAAGVFVWMAFRSARKRGQREAQLNQAEQSAGRAQEAAEIDEDTQRDDLGNLIDELRRD